MLEMARRQRESAVRQARIHNYIALKYWLKLLSLLSQAEANREILKSIGKRGNSFDYDDIEEYLKNRYFERMYQQPNHAGSVEGSKAEPNQHQMSPPSQQQQQPLDSIQGLSQSKTGAKVEDKNKSNEPMRDQIYIFDDGDDNSEDVNAETKQIRNLYRLLSRYTPNDI
jgi:hypothetical protein